ncbi:MAG: acyltransferase, partial [Anaerolineae bacterium]
LGDDVVIYSNSTVLPGVVVGDGATVGACSLVHRDVPPRCFAAGVPARVVRDASEYPRRLTEAEKGQRVLDILDRYVETLPYKGYEVQHNALHTEGEVVLEGPGGRFRLVWVPAGGEEVEERLSRFLGACREEGAHPIVVSLRPLPALEGATLLDLSRMAVLGGTDEVSEDLRDHLRRHGVRIFADRPFRALRPRALRDLLEWAGE